MVMGTPGLLEDAIAQGQQPQQLAQMSSLFAPGQAQQFETAANASLQRGDLPYYNPWSGRQWGEESAIFQNNDTQALNQRDLVRTKMLEGIGRLDPDVQARAMRDWGFAPEREVGQPNYNGMSPTDAVMGGPGGMGGGGGEEMGYRLRQELMKLKYAHELGADEREKADILRNIQGMTAMMNAQSNMSYKQTLEGGRQQSTAHQLLGYLDNLTKQHQVATQPGLGDPRSAAALAEGIEYIRSQLRQMGGSGGMEGGGARATAMEAGNPAAMALPPAEQAPAQTPWWDRAMPSNRPAPQADPNQIRQLQQQLEHLRRFAPGDLGGQMRIQRQMQDLLTGKFVPGTQSPSARQGITVHENK